MIPYSRQLITAADVAAVEAVLQSDFLTQGPVVPRFEQDVAGVCGAGHAVAVNSATSALHVACLALGLGPGDWLWTTPNTFVASANCALHCGARVDFVDIDPQSYNMSVAALTAKLEQAARDGRVPKVIVPVHFAGQSCDMAAIRALAGRYGFRIIEDASHAIGGRYRGGLIGSCGYSDITVFSFHAVKLITTGEGGMALTNDPVLAQTMALLRTHGVTRDPSLMTATPPGAWYYEQVGVGFNFRMTDLQAALGISQLSRLAEFVARRREIAVGYDRALTGLPVTVPAQHPDTESAFHLYPIRLRRDRSSRTRGEVFDGLRGRGIGVNVHYIPMHLHPVYQAMGFQVGDFPEAERYYEDAISLPIHPALRGDDQDAVVTALGELLA